MRNEDFSDNVRTAAKRPRIVTVGSGKGGSGKSLLAANLAVALAESGLRVVLVDADMGGANQHVLFGVSRFMSGLVSVVRGEIDRFDGVRVNTTLPNLKLVLSTGGGAQPGGTIALHRARIEHALHSLAADVVVLDPCGGFGHDALDLFNLGDVRLLLSTPQLTSVQNTISFLRAATLRQLETTAEEWGQVEIFRAAASGADGGPGDHQRVKEILERLAQTAPGLSARLTEELQAVDVRLLGNLMATGTDPGIFRGAARLVRDFLGIDLPVVGAIADNRQLHDSVNRRQPFLLSGSADDDEAALRNVAGSLLRAPVVDRSRSPLPPPPGEAVGDFLRRHPRVKVGWVAVLEAGTRLATAEVMNVSLGGVGLRSRHKLAHGETWNLVIKEPRLAVTVPAVVKYVDANESRFGLSFSTDDLTRVRIFEAAQPRDESDPRGRGRVTDFDGGF